MAKKNTLEEVVAVKKDFKDALLRRGVKINESLISLCRQSYKGGPDYLTSTNLFTHTRENSDDFQARLKRAYFLNYTAPVIDTYSFFLFKAPISRIYDDKDLMLQHFIENCDKKSMGLTEFMKNLTAKFLMAGTEWIVVDVPDIETKTKIEELQAGKRPYIYSIPHEDILDYEEDDNGFIWIKYREKESTKGEKWDYSGNGIKKKISIWERGRWSSYDEEGKLLVTKNLRINFVPFIQVKYADGDPLIKDIVYINRALFNWCSLLDEIIYRQTFSWLVIPGDKEETLSEKKIGTAWAWTFNPDSRHLPAFISPDTSQATLIMSQIKVAIEEIYRMASLDWSLNQISTKSGVAKAYDFMNVNKALSAIAFSLQEAERHIFKFIAKYYSTSKTEDGVEGIPDYDDNEVEKPMDMTVKYPSDFSFVALADQLDEFYEALGTSFSPKFGELIAKHLSDVLLPMIKEEDRKIIYKEIEDNYNPSLMDQYQEGEVDGFVPPGLTTEEQAKIDAKAEVDAAAQAAVPAQGVPPATDVNIGQ